jgi:hypothetical protein
MTLKRLHVMQQWLRLHNQYLWYWHGVPRRPESSPVQTHFRERRNGAVLVERTHFTTRSANGWWQKKLAQYPPSPQLRLGMRRAERNDYGQDEQPKGAA